MKEYNESMHWYYKAKNFVNNFRWLIIAVPIMLFLFVLFLIASIKVPIAFEANIVARKFSIHSANRKNEFDNPMMFELLGEEKVRQIHISKYSAIETFVDSCRGKTKYGLFRLSKQKRRTRLVRDSPGQNIEFAILGGKKNALAGKLQRLNLPFAESTTLQVESQHAPPHSFKGVNTPHREYNLRIELQSSSPTEEGNFAFYFSPARTIILASEWRGQGSGTTSRIGSSVDSYARAVECKIHNRSLISIAFAQGTGSIPSGTSLSTQFTIVRSGNGSHARPREVNDRPSISIDRIGLVDQLEQRSYLVGQQNKVWLRNQKASDLKNQIENLIWLEVREPVELHITSLGLDESTGGFRLNISGRAKCLKVRRNYSCLKGPSLFEEFNKFLGPISGILSFAALFISLVVGVFSLTQLVKK